MELYPSLHSLGTPLSFFDVMGLDTELRLDYYDVFLHGVSPLALPGLGARLGVGRQGLADLAMQV